MGLCCAIIPRVKTESGEVRDSKLYKDLLEFTDNDRKISNQIYYKTKSESFLNNWAPKLKLDDAGEPLIKELFDKTNIKDFISQQSVITGLNKRLKALKPGTKELKTVDDTRGNYVELMEKAIDFNTNSEFKDKYIATVDKTEGDSGTKLSISVKQRTIQNTKEFSKAEYNHRLNRKLENILKRAGIKVGTLTDLEAKLGISGVTDFEQAKTVADGLVELVRISNDHRGEEALPEEFAHAAFEMVNSPLKDRLLNLISAKGLYKEILGNEYDRYAEMYNDDTLSLAKEAAGKLLAKHLLNGEVIPNKQYKSLLERLITAIKNLFKGISTSEIQEALVIADKEAGDLALELLSGRAESSLNIDNIKEARKLFKITEEKSKAGKKSLEKIIKTEVKRYKIYANRNTAFDAKQKKLIQKLQRDLESGAEIHGIYTFLEEASDTLDKLSSRLYEEEFNDKSTKEKAILLRNIRNYIFSYSSILNTIREEVIADKRSGNKEFNEDILDQINTLSGAVDTLYAEYNNLAVPLFTKFMEKYMGETMVVPFGKYKGKVIKTSELVKMAEKDISFFDRWLDSMANSSDQMLRGIDKVVKISKETARLRTVEIQKKLQAAHMKLEKAGYKNTNWMFEVDDTGKRTGKYISEISFTKYRENREALYKRLDKKYGENPVGERAMARKYEEAQWYADNVETIEGMKQPKKSIYGNKDFENLTPAQREYYDEVMEIKEELDEMLPPSKIERYNIVAIRKDFLERVKSAKSFKDAYKQILEGAKDILVRRSDDTDLRDKVTVTDFEGNIAEQLPIYFTKISKLDNIDDISEDVTSTMIAYAAMAQNYNELNKVIDTLEIGRGLMREREVQQQSSGIGLKENLSAFGVKITSSAKMKKDTSHIVQRLNDYFTMQVYGRYIKDEGTFGNTKIDKAKTANFVNFLTVLNTMACNVLQGIANVTTGKAIFRTEAMSGEFFTETDVLKADRIYAKELPVFLSQIGDRVKTSKLALWSEKFDVLQDYDRTHREINMDRRTWFSRMLGTDALFFMQNSGEHWMQHRTSLALANAYKMLDNNGKECSLWDAMEVDYIDPNNKSFGAELKVKDGYTKLDGSEFTEEDLIAFIRKTAGINHRVHGIYNKADRSALQRLAVGRMAMLFRNWMRASYNRRFKGVLYDYELDSWTEGYYNTCFRFTKQILSDLTRCQFHILTNYKNLTGTEKANIRRALTEVTEFAIVSIALGLMFGGDDDDNKKLSDKSYIARMFEYQARRLYTELGAQIPGPAMISEGFKIVQSPTAGVSTLEGVAGLFRLLNYNNYEMFAGEDAVVKSGKYKGKSKAERAFLKSPFAPMYNTVLKDISPEYGIPFLKGQN